jgi:hypothetical protein
LLHGLDVLVNIQPWMGSRMELFAFTNFSGQNLLTLVSVTRAKAGAGETAERFVARHRWSPGAGASNCQSTGNSDMQ